MAVVFRRYNEATLLWHGLSHASLPRRINWELCCARTAMQCFEMSLQAEPEDTLWLMPAGSNIHLAMLRACLQAYVQLSDHQQQSENMIACVPELTAGLSLPCKTPARQ